MSSLVKKKRQRDKGRQRERESITNQQDTATHPSNDSNDRVAQEGIIVVL
jgi:hypothetical protein